eukprot:1294439-Karenia_brevis.AAC.1
MTRTFQLHPAHDEIDGLTMDCNMLGMESITDETRSEFIRRFQDALEEYGRFAIYLMGCRYPGTDPLRQQRVEDD